MAENTPIAFALNTRHGFVLRDVQSLPKSPCPFVKALSCMITDFGRNITISVYMD